ncbi:helix-turn-helix domain-containing protein [Phascolarctobacterium succinatutens]
MRQEELAEKASITPQYLSRIENGGYSKNVSLQL